MDRQTATEYGATLWKRLSQKPVRRPDRLWWLPAMGVSAYFAFGHLAGGILGGLAGWGITAILTQLDALKLEIVHIEFLRHLHEHTDESEEGKRIAEVQASVEKAVEKAVTPWWLRW